MYQRNIKLLLVLFIVIFAVSYGCGKQRAIPGQDHTDSHISDNNNPNKENSDSAMDKNAKDATPEKDDESRFKKERERMVENQIKGRGIKNKAILDAMLKVPRHEFVPPDVRQHAYEDRPLPIGHGQTISQPYIVALMTELLETDKNSKVLEVGTGSGYQAAILGEVAKEVYTIEIIKQLAEYGKSNLEKQNYKNVTVKCGDGYKGWKEHAPFDAIIVTAAPDVVPPPLISQLRVNGKMCIPVGPPHQAQELLLITKKSEKEIERKVICIVAFVPLTREKEK